MTIEDWHRDIRTGKWTEASDNGDFGVAFFGRIDFELQFVFGVLTIDPKLYETSQFLRGLNIYCPRATSRAIFARKISASMTCVNSGTSIWSSMNRGVGVDCIFG